MACWDDDEALDRFLDEHPVAQSLAGGWHVRLEPLRAVGSYTAFAGLPTEERPVHDEEPVVVLTYGRMKLRRAVPFLRANSPAAGLASEQPAMLAGTGLARPPRIVSTFSVWRTVREMRAYALGKVARGTPTRRASTVSAPSTTRQCSPVFVPTEPWGCGTVASRWRGWRRRRASETGAWWIARALSIHPAAK